MTDTPTNEPTGDVVPGQNTPTVQGDPTIPISGLIDAALEPRMSPAHTPMKRAVIQREQRPTISLEEAVRATGAAATTLLDLFHANVTRGMGLGSAMARSGWEEREARDAAREGREAARWSPPDHYAELRAELDLARARQLVEQVEANMRDVRKTLEMLSSLLRWNDERQR